MKLYTSPTYNNIIESKDNDAIPINVYTLLGVDRDSKDSITVKLFNNEQSLYISESKVVWNIGDLLVREINLESRIIECFFTSFEKISNNNTTDFQCAPQEFVLVIILIDQVRVYNRKSSALIVSFPIHIQNAFPFHKGIIISKKTETSYANDFVSNTGEFPNKSFISDPIIQGSPYLGQPPTPFMSHSSKGLSTSLSSSSSVSFTETNFLTLTDPIGDLGSIVSSSTTSFSKNEEIILFPELKTLTLAATYDFYDKCIIVYHVRYLKKKNLKSKLISNNFLGSRKNSKRSVSSGTIMNPSTSRIFDEDSHQLRSSSNPLSYDRMPSGTEHITDSMNLTSGMLSSATDTWSLRKDIIFTKINSFPFNGNKSKPKIFSITYKEKEAVIIINREEQSIHIQIFGKTPGQVDIPKLKDTICLKGLDASKFFISDLTSAYIAILVSHNQLLLFNPFYKLLSPLINIPSIFPKAISIDDIRNNQISLYCSDNNHYNFYLNTNSNDRFVKNLMESLKYLCHDLIYEKFWLHWCANKTLNTNLSDWKVYIITLLSSCFPEDIKLDRHDLITNEITELLPYINTSRQLNKNALAIFESLGFPQESLLLESTLPKIVLSLHSIREDLRLDMLATDQCNNLSFLLAQLTHWMRWSASWQLYYEIDNQYIDSTLKIEHPEYFGRPPNIMESLCSLFSDKIVKYITFSVISAEDEIIDSLITPRTYYILRLFEVIISSEYENLDLIRNMVSFNIDVFDIETFPPGIYFILKNIIEICQKNLKSNKDINKDGLKLTGRNDLLRLIQQQNQINYKSTFKKSDPKSIKNVLDELTQNETLNAWDGQSEADKFYVTQLIFSQDRRFYELTKLLQTSKIQTVTFEAANGIDDYCKLTEQRNLCATIALRTLTTPIGRGAVFNSSRKPLVTEGFPIPKMNFSILVIPDNVSVSLENDAIPEHLIDWGYFHNGTSAGLSVSKDFYDISGSWVVFNKPPTLNAQHAGFLLGLGLNGHLKNLEEWHIYNYLGPKHMYTSIGLLIGMSASLRGTMDIKITKVLSVHVVAFLPPGSTNLNVQLPVQTAGIIGIGLVYLESQHRRMSEVLLSEISSSLIINDKRIVSEGYQLASGISLGYINLGKGNTMLKSHDSHIIDDLITYSTSIRDVQTLKELDKSCSGAVMALMFMFLKTNNNDIAEKLSLSKTAQLLEYVRPDLLMLRCLAKNMIQWNLIEPTKEFVEKQIPDCILQNYSIENIDSIDTNILQFINILAGALLSISICYASTANIEAKKTLLYYFDILLDLGSIVPQNYDSKVALTGIRNARDVVILGLSIIMAGTGDLDIMRRLRFLQDITDEYTKYGNYMAVNMSLGFLCLGGGQQAFNTNDNFCIAALITSIFPMFGSNNYETVSEGDFKDFNELHLQALRHFWALAVENRCLIVRMIENENPVKLNVDVILKDETKLRVKSPCLLPALSLIQKISINSNTEYFPVEFDLLSSNPSVIEKFVKNLTLYVDKKSNYNTLKLDFMGMVDLDEKSDNILAKKNNISDNLIGIDRLKNLEIFNNLEVFEKSILFDIIESDINSLDTVSSVFDFKYQIERLLNNVMVPDNEKLINLKLIFKYVDSLLILNQEKHSVRRYKKPKKKYLGMNNSGSLDGYLDIAETEEGNSEGLNYLNIEFIEKMKKELFLKLDELTDGSIY